ncbi:MAG: nitroreductase family protein [Nitrososphaeria archaeon]
MEFEAVIKNRRSVRLFEEREVPDDILLKLVEHASLAPSPGNLQPWEFIIVKNKDLIEKIVSTTYSGNVKTSYPQTWIKSASAIIVVCYIPRPVSARYGDEGRVPGLLGLGAAIENLLLSAVNMGLGACWVSGFRPDELSKVLGLPKGSEPISIIPIGYPKEIPEAPPKLPVDQVSTFIK